MALSRFTYPISREAIVDFDADQDRPLQFCTEEGVVHTLTADEALMLLLCLKEYEITIRQVMIDRILPH